MSADTPITLPASEPGPERHRRARARTSLLAQGEPSVWLTGGAVTIALLMIIGLLTFIFWMGGGTFWPKPIVEITTIDGRRILGEPTREESYRLPDGSWADRRLIRTGNYDLSGNHYYWVSDFEIAEETRPAWAVIVERREKGNAYGVLVAFEELNELGKKSRVSGGEEAWELFQRHHDDVMDLVAQRVKLEKYEQGAINRKMNNAREALRKAEIKYGQGSEKYEEAREELAEVGRWQAERTAEINKRIAELKDKADRQRIILSTRDMRETKEKADKAVSQGLADPRTPETSIRLSDIVRAYAPNQLTRSEKFGIYASRWREFLFDDPRESNTEGGVWPAIWGTVAMTLIMSLLVVPFGVMAAIYLREYAKKGPIVSAVRVAVGNLAGVPSIVFGVFGLGFFCYIVGGNIDKLLYEERLPSPTYGKGGLLWASLTLALLTLPVVIVSTEEALAAVPNSLREGSYACGASKWQTIRRIVLPRAIPGILTGAILAMARGAGEVAPLMLVGAVKYAPELPVDGIFPYVHPERSFMHLGFHIYDVGFQSPNSEAAKPMVFTTTLLLITIIAVLNITAVWLRSRLRRRYKSSQF